ncbi:MAG: DNA repair protein RecN [Bulleidia sp.]
MIKHLYIQNFVLIQKLALDFEDGFSAFTGETGAGKSILIDAISLLCAERSSASLVGKDGDRAIIEGTFDLTRDPHAQDVLKEAGFECEPEVTFTREITSSGRNTVRIDHRVASLSLLKECLSNQVDIHGQRDNSYLLNPNNHLHLVDEYLNDKESVEQVKKAYGIYHDLCEQKEALLHVTFNEEDLEYARYQIAEIENADLKVGEDEELEEKEKRYQSLRDSYEKLSEISQLYENEVSGPLYEMNRLLSSIRSDTFEKVADTVNDCYYSLEDAMHTLADIRDDMDLSEEEINAMEERLFTISRLKRKYGRTIEDILARKDELQKTVESFSDREKAIAQMDRKIEAALQEYNACAEKLSELRRKGVVSLDREIQVHLKDLMLEKAAFRTVFIDEDHPTSHGSETCQFHVSMNRGDTLKPLHKTASGGELSRLMLGLKVIFTKLQGIDTVIFDEIDTGVSGPVATAIGKKMKSLSETCQVFAVTHLAQVAACADHHYFVSKADDANATRTSVRQLDYDGILHQLALIASGVISDASLSAAKELYERNHG